MYWPRTSSSPLFTPAALEELGQFAAGVVLDALAFALDPFVLAFALLAEAGQATFAAGGDAALVAFDDPG
jgi:hypothetical protein